MQVTIKVVKVLDLEEGKSDKGEWKRRKVVGVTLADYPKTLCFTFTGERTQQVERITPNSILNMRFEPVSRESTVNEGQWFTELNAYGYETLGTKEG